MFCSQCLRIFHFYNPNVDKPDREADRQPHHETPQSLARSSQSGCSICTLVHLKIPPFYRAHVSTTYLIEPLHDDADVRYRDDVGRYDAFFSSRPTGKVFLLHLFEDRGPHLMSYRLDRSNSMCL